MLAERLLNVKNDLRDNDFTLADYLLEVLATSDQANEERQSVVHNAVSICEALLSIESAGLFTWLWQKVEEKLVGEMTALTHVKAGLHFNASHCTSQFLEGSDSFTEEISRKIRANGPLVWRLVQRLLDAQPERRRAAPRHDVTWEDIEAELGEDLGELGDNRDEMNTSDGQGSRAETLNTALLFTVSWPTEYY